MALFPRLLFGTLREHYLLLFGMAGGIALVAGFVGAWVGARFGARAAARRAVREQAETQGPSREVLGLMEQLEAVALEVERLAEGQRFVAKLLGEQRDRGGAAPALPPTPRREPGQITPH